MAEYRNAEAILTTHRVHRHRRDTLIKASVVVNSSHQKTLAASVAEMVDADLRGNCHTVDTDAFLRSIFPLSERSIDSIYEHVLANKAYIAGSWTGLPKDEQKENCFYVPFANATNAINAACAASGAHMPVKSHWLDRHSTPPRSRDEDAAAIRPDVVSVLGTVEAIEGWEKGIASLKKRMSESKDIMSKDLNDVREMVRVGCTTRTDCSLAHYQEKELTTMLETWWLRVHIPVEIKPRKDDADVLGAVKQLCGYLRQVLREQIDRRFALGLAFCSTDLSVWLCDRSGLLGTATPFNIHEVSKSYPCIYGM
jgi:hypothetical protein